MKQKRTVQVFDGLPCPGGVEQLRRTTWRWRKVKELLSKLRFTDEPIKPSKHRA